MGSAREFQKLPPVPFREAFNAMMWVVRTERFAQTKLEKLPLN
jgi:hypothetical protein